MSILNTATCSTFGGNTGASDCSFDIKALKKGFLVPNSFVLTEAQLASTATVLAALTAAANNDIPALRIYPLPETVLFTDNSEDVVTQTLGFGIAVVVRDGRYNFTFQFLRGGLCLSKQLRRFNGGGYRWLGIDDSGALIGTKVGTGLKGVPLDQFYASPAKINDGTNITAYTYRLTMDPAFINEGVGFVAMNYADVANISGLQNVNVKSLSRVGGVLGIKLTAGCAETDLYDIYATEFADPTNFVATQNGAVVNILSVAANPNTKGWIVTLDTADADYQAGQPVTLNLAPVSVLADNGIVGYEGIPSVIA